MRRYVVLLSLVLFPLVGLTLPKEVRLDHEIKVTTIAPDVYVATDTAYFNSNVLITKMAEGTVVIASSPFESVGTGELMKWVKTTLRPKKIIVINTHFHRDGTGGNDVYRREGAEIWASDLTRRLHIEESKKPVEDTLKNIPRKDLKERLRKAKAVPADKIFPLAEGKRFEIGGETVEVIFPGAAHSPDNVVVYFPKRKILFGGCMIKPRTLGYLGDADVKSWPAAARKLTELDVTLVVPGHGAWGGADLITKTVEVAERALKQG